MQAGACRVGVNLLIYLIDIAYIRLVQDKATLFCE